MNCSMPGLPVHHQLSEFTQTQSIESVMPSSHLILCRPLLLLPPIPPSITVLSNESTLHMRWPKYWSFSFSIIPSKEIPGLISFRKDWLESILLSSQGYGFSSGHVWMWELDCEEGWAPKNWCFWTVLLEKILESPLDIKEIKPVHPKANQSWIFTEGTDAEAEAPATWCEELPHWKRPCCWSDLAAAAAAAAARKDWRQEKGTTENEMIGWPHQLDGYEFEQALEVGDGQGSLTCCSPWGCN